MHSLEDRHFDDTLSMNFDSKILVRVKSMTTDFMLNPTHGLLQILLSTSAKTIVVTFC